MLENIPELREKIEKGVALLEITNPSWINTINPAKLGFWRDSETPLEQIFQDEYVGRAYLFGTAYASRNLTAEQFLNLEEHGFWLYQSKYTIHQLALEWRTYVTERREQDGREKNDTGSNSV